MKVFLMARDRDFGLQEAVLWNAAALKQDLELDTLLDALAGGDAFVREVAESALLAGAGDLDTIRYRQGALRDCLRNPDVVRALYQVPVEAQETKRRHWLSIFGTRPSSILYSATEMLQMLVGALRRLRAIADEGAGGFTSEGFTRFFAMLQRELSDEYLATIEAHLRELRFRDGVLISAELGRGNESQHYVLRKPNGGAGWMRRALAGRAHSYSFSIHPRDQAGGRALADLRDRGLNRVANAAAQSADHVDSFFRQLRLELAFYVGCLNLYERLTALGEVMSFPQPAAPGEMRLTAQGLYDPCLALAMGRKVVANDVQADGRKMVIITGANQGGKSTFLRSVGVAQLMMGCGMVVPAEALRASLASGLFTHYRREEDTTMTSGKLDEELSRMSEIAAHLGPGAWVLFNESFAATNEREGSEIARQIVRALVESGVRVLFVTHLYEFAHSLAMEGPDRPLFLRAQRQSDGRRAFRLVEGEPLQTSYAADLYQNVFG